MLSSARFVSKAGVLPHWLNIDFESSKYVHKIIVIPRTRYFKGLEEIILTVGKFASYFYLQDWCTSLQTSCYESVHKLSTNCVRTACS